MTLRRVGGVEELEIDEELCCYSPVTGRLMILGGTGRLVWEICDGAADIAAVVSRVAELVDLPPGTIGPAVQKAVESFLSAGFMERVHDRPPW